MSTNKSSRIIISLIISLSIWVGFLLLSCTDLHYQFFHLMHGEWFLSGIAALFVIPACFVVLICFLGYKNKVLLFGISIIVYILVLVFLLFLLFSFSLYTPFFSSFSNNPLNFGKYDQHVSAQVNQESGLFPTELPKGAEVEQYFYWYCDGAAPHYCIMLDIYFINQNDYQAELDRLKMQGRPAEEENEGFRVEEYEFDISFLWDDGNKEIVYFFFSRHDRDLIPKSFASFDRARFTDTIFENTD